VSFRSVWASRGKYVRAEPVSALYEQGRVHHAGSFAQLEDQFCSWVPDMDRASMGSPDRTWADSLKRARQKKGTALIARRRRLRQTPVAAASVPAAAQSARRAAAEAGRSP
jgi:phage terminase large subunit-like protein